MIRREDSKCDFNPTQETKPMINALKNETAEEDEMERARRRAPMTEVLTWNI